MLKLSRRTVKTIKCYLLFYMAYVASAQESIDLSHLKKDIGRQSVTVRTTGGELFSGRLLKIDPNASLTFKENNQQRSVSCSAIEALEFESRSRRRKRSRLYSGFANLTLPVVIVVSVTPSLGASAPLLLLWPGSFAWGKPLSNAIIKRKTAMFRVTCR